MIRSAIVWVKIALEIIPNEVKYAISGPQRHK